MSKQKANPDDHKRGKKRKQTSNNGRNLSDDQFAIVSAIQLYGSLNLKHLAGLLDKPTATVYDYLNSLKKLKVIEIDSEATNEKVLHIDADTLTSNTGLSIDSDSAGFTGAGGIGLFFVRVDNVAATGDAARITNDGSGVGLYIDQNGDNAAIQLQVQNTAPATCTIGGVYMDSSGAYCVCTATNVWENMGSTGTCA